MFRSNQTASQSVALPQPTPEAATVSPAPEAPPELKPPGAGTKAVVLLEEYGDYQCPPCGGLHPVINGIKKEYGDKVRLVFYQLPLTGLHKNALAAAHAAVAAKLQNRFWEMHDKLYESQNVWAEFADIRPLVIDYARQFGMNVEQFKNDMESRRVAALVQADMQRAKSLQIESTPTLTIEGQIFPNEKLSPENLRVVINRFLVGAASPVVPDKAR